MISRWSAHILHILNVRLIISGSPPAANSAPAMFVANHVSWLDIWAINAVRTVHFVAKSEVRDWPLIGWLAEQAGVIFIERARRRDTSRVASAGAMALRQGQSLCVFPEGTTSDGTHLHPFRSSLLQSAVEAAAPVWPVTIKYLLDDGMPNTRVAYAGDTSLAESMRAILSHREILLHLVFSEPIASLGRDRRELADQAEAVIAAEARLPVRGAPETPCDLPA